MRTRFVISISTAGAVAVLAWGCGGGGGSSSEAPPLTKAAFVKRANALCKSAEEKRGKTIKAALSKVPRGVKASIAEQEEVVLAALPPYDLLAEEFGELSAPKGDEGQVEAILASLEASVERARSEPRSALDDAAFQKFNKEVSAYGLSACTI